MKDLALENISHRFGSTLAVDSASLTVGAGEFVCLVGPSGCGKTTLLRVAAGLEELQNGRVLIDGEVMADGRISVPPEDRNVGLVFQDFALFPHMNVRANVAFGLRDLSGSARDERVGIALERTGMAALADAYPHELSGGQQQRVALARAIAPRPRVVLLDEPFSGLDATLRHRVRDQTAQILRESEIATLMVTHDAEEAMYIADRIAVMKDGRLHQIGTPDEIYLTPADSFVAAFFGEVNRFTGTVANGHVDTPLGPVATNGTAPGCSVEVLVRPEALGIDTVNGETHGTVTLARFLGRSSLIEVRLSDPAETVVRVHVPGRYLPQPGETVAVRRDAEQTFVFPRDAS